MGGGGENPPRIFQFWKVPHSVSNSPHLHRTTFQPPFHNVKSTTTRFIVTTIHIELLLTPLQKKVKMAVLKYFKVGSDGKIQRLRRECPSATCGAGVFMAQHADRQSCGKCGLTYVFEK